MKIFDINTAVGHWPFRKLELESASKLRNALESHGISRAAAVNTNGIFYKNCHDANLELHSWLRGDENFFTGIATINPVYAKWDKDLRESVERLGFKGVRIVPQYHDYELASAPAAEIADLAAALDIPVFIPYRIIDIRQRHWLDTEKVNDFESVYNFCIRHPETPVIYTEAVVSAESFNGKEKCSNLFIEISRMRSVYGQQISKLAAAIGTEQLLFGSGAPFKEISPALLKLRNADLPEAAQKQLAGENAVRILKPGTGNE
ncbi:MAG: amidohydrolase family protein [Victivallaceae bacterium]|nr:amidohydrolase family protein [Victivallaceae bacterium]